jgi:conflict system pore-forming effector with SLATT domain
MAKMEDFILLYLRYRLDDMIRWHEKRSSLTRRRNQMLQAGIVLALVVAVASSALANLDRASVTAWVVAGVAFSAVALALATGVLAFGLGRQADVHSNAARSLARMRDRKPGPTASELELERWIWQTEAIISSATSDVEPLSGGLPSAPGAS